MSGKLPTKLGGLLASAAVHSWMGTLDYRALMYDRTVDPTQAEFEGPVIAVFWHEYLLALFYLRGRSNTAILTSQHRDADWLSEAARHMGFDTIRGSTYRGGTRAMLQFIRQHGSRNLGIACDGPRGPRRRLAQGPIYLSSKLQIPLVIHAVGYDRPWRMPTWDRFAVPYPYSRVRLIVGPRIQIPADVDRAGVIGYQHAVERMMRQLTVDAESWAAAGTRRQGQMVLRRQPAHPDATYCVPVKSEPAKGRLPASAVPARRRAA